MQMVKSEFCPKCNGKGKCILNDNKTIVVCKECGGSGMIIWYRRVVKSK